MNIPFFILALSFLPFFEARNQVANFVYAPPADGTSVKPERPSLIVRDTCPGCEGEGRLVLVEPNHGQANGRLGGGKKIRKECPLCRGSKKIEAFMNPAELSLQVAKDRVAFAAEHQGKGDIAVGEAFVPNAKYRELDKATLKLVDEAFGDPCRKCNWTGLEACRECHGNGTVKCTNSDCKGGWAVVKTTTEKTVTKSGGSSGSFGSRGGFRSSGGSRRTHRKETTVNVSPCPTCGGAKFLPCHECSGRRAHPCKKCNGLGVKVKGGSL